MLEAKIDKFKRDAVNIMVNNEDLFPIVRMINRFSNSNVCTLSDSDKYTFLYLTLLNTVGLSYVVKKKLESLSELDYILPNEFRKVTDSYILQSILTEYVSFISDEQKEKFYELFEPENNLF